MKVWRCAQIKLCNGPSHRRKGLDAGVGEGVPQTEPLEKV